MVAHKSIADRAGVSRPRKGGVESPCLAWKATQMSPIGLGVTAADVEDFIRGAASANYGSASLRRIDVRGNELARQCAGSHGAIGILIWHLAYLHSKELP